ncbi:hypothetical protein BDV36DRAFT_243491 [Aspergillus pseudocaelatus]|uniref:Uncharacterized protein n=1 Tax=Aspergillus pseudocaelatus TaxID=1825620 RepID=A0ABQ6X279_9EURO|nr:hypothetical protein BDV36DRAFT_243491 [Aspergillus pseudocaelatus]
MSSLALLGMSTPLHLGHLWSRSKLLNLRWTNGISSIWKKQAWIPWTWILHAWFGSDSSHNFNLPSALVSFSQPSFNIVAYMGCLA